MKSRKCSRCQVFLKKYPLINNCHIIQEKSPCIKMTEITCAFDNKEKKFNKNNWNCATMNKLREIAKTKEDCHYFRTDDCGTVGIIPVFADINLEITGYLVMMWYKEQGRTDQAYIMNIYGIHPLYLEDAEALIRYYEGAENRPISLVIHSKRR